MNELKKRHRAFQKKEYPIDHSIKAKKENKPGVSVKQDSSFFCHVNIFLGSLFVLCVSNIFVIIFLWIPEVSKRVLESK